MIGDRLLLLASLRQALDDAGRDDGLALLQ